VVVVVQGAVWPYLFQSEFCGEDHAQNLMMEKPAAPID
jgi:hypothetical protein